MIDAGFDRYDYGSISRNCDREGDLTHLMSELIPEPDYMSGDKGKKERDRVLIKQLFFLINLKLCFDLV